MLKRALLHSRQTDPVFQKDTYTVLLKNGSVSESDLDLTPCVKNSVDISRKHSLVIHVTVAVKRILKHFLQFCLSIFLVSPGDFCGGIHENITKILAKDSQDKYPLVMDPQYTFKIDWHI